MPESNGRRVRIVCEQIGDSGICTPMRTHVYDAESGEEIQGIISVDINISRSPDRAVRATIVLEPVSVNVTGWQAKSYG